MSNRPTTAKLSQDVIFQILSNKRRRETLSYLDENGGESSIGVVAEYVASRENGIEPHQLTGQQRKRVMIALYQNHLPKMDDCNVIDYDQARGTITLREEAEQLLPHLALDPSRTDTAVPRMRITRTEPVEKLRAKLSTLALD